MKLGGLFSGIGGFELAWTRLGGEVAWMCEWDKNARKVLEARFPGVPIYPDVRDLDPAEVEAVDVLTGGSPCQGFSVAGQRTGLLHGESRLFADYVRIMDGLAARGLKWALWENVPGVLSITNDNGERTFPHVAAALVGADKPLRLGAGRWNTGLADGGGRAVAWRVLDSRYFGVAQRRRRVFACVAFGDSPADRAGRALLAKSEGVSGDSASGGPEGEGVAGGVASSIGVPSVAGTLAASGAGTSRTSGNGNFLDFVIPDAADGEELSPTVTSKWHKGSGGPSGNETGNMVLQAFRKSRRPQSNTDDETWVDDGLANTVNTFDVGETRTTHAVVEPWAAEETGTLQARTHKGLNHENVRDGQAVVQTYGVRRLTPVECERLQSFPDGWTEPAVSDSARYKAMGNAVTVNTVRWILGRMLEQS